MCQKNTSAPQETLPRSSTPANPDRPPTPVTPARTSTPTTQTTSPQASCSTGNLSGLASLESYVPTYSVMVQTVLDKGDIFKMWDTFIAEKAYHVLAVGGFDDRGTYAMFGQKMYQLYPCIGVNIKPSLKDAGSFFTSKLSMKVRNIRWKWNSKSKRSQVPKPPMVKSAKFAIIPGVNAQRRSLWERRTYIGTNSDVGVAKIVEKYPFLGNKKFIEKEFFLMQPSQSNASISDNWASVLYKLCKVFGFSEDQDDDSTPNELEVLERLESRIKYTAKKSKASQPLIFRCLASELETSKVPKGTPPSLALVMNADGTRAGCAIINEEKTLLVFDGLIEGLTGLMFAYYVWDLSYPKHFQLLGFIQQFI